MCSEDSQEFDFLSSIELLIVDGADTIMMQNFEHLESVFEHTNRQPVTPRETDYARVRQWYLNLWAKHYRQTVILSSVVAPEINSLHTRLCANRAGSVHIRARTYQGSVNDVVHQLRQIFTRVRCGSPSEQHDARFEYFVSEVLPRLRESVHSHILLFVPSYFDYVRIRNYFDAHEIDFGECSE